MTDAEILALPGKERMLRVLDGTFDGLHHAGNYRHHFPGTKAESIETNVFGDLSTFDFDRLTRLVLFSHFLCVRATVTSSGPRMVKIILHPRRNRDGKFFERHPTLAEAAEKLGLPKL